MGRLEVRKRSNSIKFKDGKVVTDLPVNWDATLKLWYEDEESYNNKILIREENKETFRIHYNKIKANYNNKSFYQFFHIKPPFPFLVYYHKIHANSNKKPAIRRDLLFNKNIFFCCLFLTATTI